MVEYALFLGCTTPSRVLDMELATRKVFDALGVRLHDMKGAGCCGPVHIESLDHKTWLANAARNIAIAEEMGMDILTVCNGCVATLDAVNKTLKRDAELRGEVNQILADVGREFKGTIEVHHVLDVLSQEEMAEKIRQSVVRPLKGIRAGVHHGCHLLRPSDFRKLDDPMNPRVLSKMVEVLGATSVPYVREMLCCGSGLRGIEDGISMEMIREKLRNVQEAGANCIVTSCPFCFLQYDMGQIEVQRKFKEEYNLPVLHYQQLLAIALGMDVGKLGLDTHKVKADALLGKLK
jgi:heterodisulfide reductase subunit B